MFKVFAKNPSALMINYEASDAIARADRLNGIGKLALVKQGDKVLYKSKLARAKHESAFPNGFEGFVFAAQFFPGEVLNPTLTTY